MKMSTRRGLLASSHDGTPLVGQCRMCRFGGQLCGVLAADEDGWMNVNISFTLLSQQTGLIHLPEVSVIWRVWSLWPTLPLMDHPEPPHSHVCGYLSRLFRCWGTDECHRSGLMCICQREWTCSFSSNCLLHSDKWCLSKTVQKNKCRNAGLTLLWRSTNGSSRQAGSF